MVLLDALPTRPLSASELASLNRAERVDLAVGGAEDGNPTTSVLLATETWVKAVVFDGDAWQVVETVTLDDVERFDALRTCEDAIRRSKAV